MNALTYYLFKILRFNRLMEFDQVIEDNLDYYGKTKTVQEVKNDQFRLNFWKFIIQTFISIHLFSAIQIMLCRHVDDYSNSWMGGRGVKESDKMS